MTSAEKTDQKTAKPLEEMEISEETHNNPSTSGTVTDPPREMEKVEKVEKIPPSSAKKRRRLDNRLQ